MFGIDFYPTPVEVIEKMLNGVMISGKTVLEPSAGKGDIVQYLSMSGAKEVLACEIDYHLRSILENKPCRIIEDNFLDVTSECVSHIDLIVMNPPFSKGAEHILHAWEIAPSGCHIIALCNESTLSNTFSQERQKLSEIVKFNGNAEKYGSCFDNSERRTGVSVSCINLYKQAVENDEFFGYFDLSEDEEEKCDVPGLMSYNYVRDVVGRYIDAVNMFDEVEEINSRISSLISPIDGTLQIRFGAFNFDRNSNPTKVSRDTFKKELQKSAWRSIFGKFDLEKFVTRGVREQLNKYIETQEHVPFTMKNVYKMIEMVIGTSESRMNDVFVEAFEKICSFSSENSTAGEKWKTNSDYMLNRRFIKPYVCEWDKRWPRDYVEISSVGGSSFDDIIKALCHLTGENYENYIPLSYFFSCPYKLQRKDGTLLGGYHNCFRDLEGWSGAKSRRDELLKQGVEVTIIKTEREWGQWVDWGFFRVRGYKKGTMHFEFIDERVWEMFNRRVAEIKGWRLPKTTKKAYRAKTEGVTLF
ncbi:MAG: DUF4942 domain-containing protein [Paludibacter sp.]